MSNINPKSKDRTAEPPDRFQAGWLDAMDYRTALARELRDRFETVCTDLGGRDSLSYMQRSLVERALWLEYWLSQQERELAKGNDFEVGRWTQAANSLQGIYSKLGLERKARDVPDLQTYLKQKAAEKAEAADAE